MCARVGHPRQFAGVLDGAPLARLGVALADRAEPAAEEYKGYDADYQEDGGERGRDAPRDEEGRGEEALADDAGGRRAIGAVGAIEASERAVGIRQPGQDAIVVHDEDELGGCHRRFASEHGDSLGEAAGGLVTRVAGWLQGRPPGRQRVIFGLAGQRDQAIRLGRNPPA
eukprot:scaffold110617_cov45-Phaeocystis_antarctica.AAC.2